MSLDFRRDPSVIAVMAVQLNIHEANAAINSLRTLLSGLTEGLSDQLACHWPEEQEPRAAILADVAAIGEEIASIAELIRRVEERH